MNNRINDRGMMKFQGFFMTEHNELLREAKRDYFKVEKPIISEEQIEEFERLISESLEFQSNLEITIWKDGFFETELCQVKKVDQLNRKLHLYDKEGRMSIMFKDIVAIKSN